MACDIHLSVSTAYGKSLDMDVDYIRLPTGYGYLGILKNHGDMLCAVSPGMIDYTADGERGSIEVGEGVATVSANQVIVLVSEINCE